MQRHSPALSATTASAGVLPTPAPCSRSSARTLAVCPRAAAAPAERAQQPAGQQTTILHPPQPLQCLKEWAVTCAALQAGEQTILLRKGGIREPLFKPQASRFLMFPTAFHSQEQLLKSGVAERYEQAMALDPKQLAQLPLGCFAEVTGAWTTLDERVLEALEPLHVYAPGFLQTRLKWRAKEPLTLLELRCWDLDQPRVIPTRADYFGCFSWVTLLPEDSGQVDDGGGSSGWAARAALSDADFSGKQQLLRERLQQLEVQQLQLKA